MTTRTATITLVVALATGLATDGVARTDVDRASLKQRFVQRYKQLVALKDAGRVGETYRGTVDAVAPTYLDDRVVPGKDDAPTIREFLAAENADRRTLYELIAAETGTTADQVAKRNAARNFERAAPEHYLQLPSGKWVKKKNLRKRTE